MTSGRLRSELERIGRRLRRGRAGIRALYGLGAVLGALCLFGGLDLLLHLGRGGRMVVWCMLLALLGCAAWWIQRTLRARFTPESVAVTVERGFPELDNRLINTLLFAGAGPADVYIRAYLNEGVPGWERVDPRRLVGRTARRNAWIAAAVGVLLALAPALVSGRAWTTAMWRVMNPFADVRPVSLTHVLGVDPGNTVVRRGEGLLLKCIVRGHAGHTVRLDVHPADGERTVYPLGRMKGEGTETFTHWIPKVTADLRYRFRAGDAPFPAWYTVGARPPLAVTEARLVVTPPPALDLATHVFDGLTDTPEIPRGSTVRVLAQYNLPVKKVDLAAGDGAAGAMARAPEPNTWQADVEILGGDRLVLRAVGEAGEELDTPLGYRIWDAPPPEAPARAAAVEAPEGADAETDERKAEQQAEATLERVRVLQRENVEHTEALFEALPGFDAAGWDAALQRQRDVRSAARELVTANAVWLGALAPAVKRLYANDMAEAVDLLERVGANTTERTTVAKNALSVQRRILRQLDYAAAATARAGVERHVDALSQRLDALIAGENGVVERTDRLVEGGARPGAALVDRQDGLAMDLTAFRDACRAEAERARANDAGFAELLAAVAAECESRKVRDNMLLAAERLEAGRAADALPHAKQALADLRAFRARFDTVQAQAAAEKDVAMAEALENAKVTLRKIRELHARALDSMEMVKDQRDASSAALEDMMEEDYRELVRNTKEALLQVPKDLHIFMELNVANELIEDVFTLFEEIEQVAGSDTVAEEDLREQAFNKVGMEMYLDAMEEAEGRLDDMEMWMGDKPDRDTITAEAFDQEEMPEEGIALGALATEVEDLIGDLLEESEELAEDSVDSAMNFALPDWESGWEIAEGETVSFGAKGKSSNERPDHKEQDGRSIVGRQGMADGETAAGSGTINEGDDTIEARRTQEPTQDGQVDVDGEADTRATGGGKLGTGKADELGMTGGQRRMDAMEQGSREGLDALLARRADTVYAKASLSNVRAGALQEAAHHLRQAGDAIADGEIGQVRELRRRAVAALREARTELEAGARQVEAGAAGSLVDDLVAGGPEAAPRAYRELVAEYYKALNDAL
jgi:hypothetical protein